MKKIISIILVFITALSLSGCVITEEKDMQTTVLTINGEDIKKEEFMKFVNYTALAYKAYSDTDIFADDETAKKYKELLFDGFEDSMLKVYAAKEEGLKLKKKDIQKTADADYHAIKEALVGNKGTDKKLLVHLKEYGFESIKEFKTYTYIVAERNAYTEKLSSNYIEKKAGDEATTAFTIMTTDKIDVPAYLYYYYYFNRELTDYASSGGQNTEKSEEEQEAYYEDIAGTLAADVKLVEAGKEKGYEFSKKEIKEKTQSTAYPQMLYGEKEVTNYLKGHGINSDQYKKARDYQAIAVLSKEKLEKNLTEEVKEAATDKDAEKFYNKNKNRYSTATVSAKHILIDVGREDLAKYIKKQADDSGFEVIYDLYERSTDRSEAILEISDLGVFDYKTMVTDFSEAAFNTDVGKTIGPVKTEFGYHIIYVYDKQDGEIKAFEDVKKEAKQDYVESETKVRVQKEVNSLIEKPKFKITDKEGIKMPYDKYIENFKESFNLKTYKKKAVR